MPEDLSVRPVPDHVWELANLEAHLVQRLGSLPRTKLVKLVYLIDERHFRLHGKTVTGQRYVYDAHGPNAVGNAIVKVGDLLDGFEVEIRKAKTAQGHDWYQYVEGPRPRFDPSVPPETTDTIDAIVEECGRMTVETIVRASKATRPFRDNPQPGSKLRFTSLVDDARARLGALQAAAAERRRHLGTPEDGDFGPEEPRGSFVDDAQRRALVG